MYGQFGSLFELVYNVQFNFVECHLLFALLIINLFNEWTLES